jgi:2'-5' RNA ligase
MSNSLRLFVAVELSQDVHDRLCKLITELKAHGSKSARWVKPENLHLTLKFLGDTPPQSLAGVKAAIQSVCASTEAFQLNVRGSGAFPSLKQPRVLWAGLEADSHLKDLAAGLDASLEKLGYKKETRPFSPHLTLARIAYPEDSPAFEKTMKALLAAKDKDFGSVNIRRITLFQSTLAPGGSIYTPLERFQLLEKV